MRSGFRAWHVLVLWALVQLPSVAFAGITAVGDVLPANPATWTTSTWGYVGRSSSGSLTVNAGSHLNSYYGYLGSGIGATGSVTVDGTGTAWNCTSDMQVGYGGSGMLQIANGAAVTSNWALIGGYIGGIGSVFVTGPGTTWTSTEGLDVGGMLGSGTLQITNGAAVINRDAYIGDYSGATGSVSVTGPSTTWTNTGSLTVGNYGSGTLRITNGAAVINRDADIGRYSGATGSVIVTGPSTTWTCTSGLYMGYSGSGTLQIAKGAVISSNGALIGLLSGATGSVIVDGTGTTWNCTSNLALGSSGSGTLRITNGAAVTATSVSMNSQSLLAMDVGCGSRLSVAGSFYNPYVYRGTVRLMAPAIATTGDVCTPISAATWSGDGSVQALGGIWNSTSHQFTVSAVQAGTAGTPVTLDLSQKQRVRIDGSQTSVGASFLSTATPITLTFQAVPLTGDLLLGLTPQLNGSTIVSSWLFATRGGYTSGDPAYLSFDLGAGRDSDDLMVWHYAPAVGQWTKYAADDLNYDGRYANFTVTDLNSGYALTVAVPEPSTLALFGAGAMGLLLCFLRRRPGARSSHRELGRCVESW